MKQIQYYQQLLETLLKKYIIYLSSPLGLSIYLSMSFETYWVVTKISSKNSFFQTHFKLLVFVFLLVFNFFLLANLNKELANYFLAEMVLFIIEQVF